MRPLTKVSSGASEPPPRDPATGCAACAGPAGSAAATPAAAPALSKLRRDRRLRSLFSSLIGQSGWVTSNTRLSGEGPNDGQVTLGVWFTPSLDQTHTPSGKMRSSGHITSPVNGTA